MIRLQRGNVPTELNEAKVLELTAQYEADGSSVWNASFIRDALLASSNSKFSYCETKIDEESKYMEVDHFRCKRDFPDLVVSWSNLLPACKRCNGRKSTYNVDHAGMIVDPFTTDPVKHLFLHNYRLRARDEIGRSTIDALYLNQSDRLVSVRLSVGEAVNAALERIRSQLEDYVEGEATLRRRNTITRGMEKLLTEAGPEAEYSSITATVLLSDPDYGWIREELVRLGWWDSLSNLESRAQGGAIFR